jgi:hypothetical protein
MRLKVLYGAILVVASLAAPIQALANPISLVCVSSQLTWVITIDATARIVDGCLTGRLAAQPSATGSGI